jgi:hypothetical protein
MLLQNEPKRQLICLLFMLGCVLLTVFIAIKTAQGRSIEPIQAANQLPVGNESGSIGPNCRYGVASFTEDDNPFISQLGAGWMVNFEVNLDRPVPSGVEYVPIIRMKQERDPDTGARLPSYYLWTPPLNDDPGGLGPLIAANPGLLWLVGNEVDRVVWQDDIMPDIYAIAYHDIYHFIKDRDPTAQVGISGLVEVTPGRLQYLDIVWDSYLEMYGTPMSVDIWNMHVYILPEIKANGQASRAAVALGTDPALAILESDLTPNQCPLNKVYCYAEHDDMGIFNDQVRAMRQWMKANGQQNKPLILSEYSQLYPYDNTDPGGCFLQDEYGNCFTPARVSQFMIDSFAYLETVTDTNLGYPYDDYRLVQQWLWYAMHDGSDYPSNNLVDDRLNPTQLTSIGQTFLTEVNAQALEANLIPSYVSSLAVTGTTTATISAEIRNNGNISVTNPMSVTFYADEAQTVVIDSVTLPAGLDGCARRGGSVSVQWSGLSAGVNRYWVVVDSGGAVAESDEADNVLSGFVIVDPEQVFLPVFRR